MTDEPHNPISDHVSGGIWLTAPVGQVPSIDLISWQVVEVAGLKEGNLDHHFVGYNITQGEGRTSSKIVSFDKETKIGVTRSGRRYKLVGSPGFNQDAMYVWRRWMEINKVVDFKDVSGLYSEA